MELNVHGGLKVPRRDYFMLKKRQFFGHVIDKLDNFWPSYLTDSTKIFVYHAQKSDFIGDKS